ncbi:phosphoglycerate mutase family [Pyrenophora seminiperda CCB06]|uniref:Phosphoglycerate mutase family n=1 Tax=Pyrenophora seminiperda CCB06 TaxID=1302712 RepID=A0A3M7MIP9_9PLEO|nr:phosphoglycerate mutase family [Pyrenophora seminiperda CCB06]
MVQSVKLILIRHGETVDNVAQVYRDSALTNHGVQQAIRLGLHFQTLGLAFTHLFSSQLQRAANTAAQIRQAQLILETHDNAAETVPVVLQLPVLMEQDFGSMEGKKFHDPSHKSEHPRNEKNRHGIEFVPMESKDTMARRADSFIDEHLMPLLGDTSKDMSPVVAIVSHGIFLSMLWKRLLLRLPRKSVVLSPELRATARPSLEHLGGWSNTGYLELHLQRAEAEEPSPSPAGMSRITQGWTTTILTINGKDHLRSLKRTGGGVGSARHDASQKRIDTFFKRRRVG